MTTPSTSTPVTAPSRSRWRDLAGPALFEAAFVVLGVIFALAANEWRETRRHEAEAASARTAIINEMRANRARADESRQYHQGLAQRIFSAPPGKQLTVPDFSRGFISPAPLSWTAWEVASETGALSYMPYEEVLAISQVVAVERRYDAMAVSTGQLLYSELYRGGPGGVVANQRNLASILYAFFYREAGVIARIDSTLAIVDPGK